MSSGSLPKLVSEPEWMRQVAQDSSVGARDIAEIFDINVSSISRMVKLHGFPAPDSLHKGGKTIVKRWLVATIRKEIRRRITLHQQRQQEKLT